MAEITRIILADYAFGNYCGLDGSIAAVEKVAMGKKIWIPQRR